MQAIKTKQPRALSVFFLTEMWERYGFYVIQSLLALYLIHVFHLDDVLSYGILGSVTALAYINSIIGGYIADQWIGHRFAVLLGALCLSAGYALLSLVPSVELGAASLAVITLGTGLLKPNVSSMVGSLYGDHDPRRHSGFTLFYVGINLGIILATTGAGYIQQYFGWHVAFLSASMVLLIAFMTFYFGTRYFHILEIRPLKVTFWAWVKALGGIVLTIWVSDYIIKNQHASLYAFFAIAILSVLVVFYEAFVEKGQARRRILAYLILVGISTVYWAIYFQLFFSMNLFVARVVDRTLWGATIPASVFLSIEAFGIIFFGPLMCWAWTRLQGTRWAFSTPTKFALGLGMNAIAFGLLFVSAHLLNAQGMVMPGWLVVVYLLIAVGELFLSPIGLAMVTELVPLRLVGMMMGIFFISLGIGGKLAGLFADISAVPANIVSVAGIDHIYQHAFLVYFLIAAIAAAISFGLIPVVKRLII